MENITVTETTPARRAAVAGLAVVGFFALVFIGMVLAIYAARFVPTTASGLSSAAAGLSSVFTPAGTPALTTVPNQVAFPAATSTDTSTAVAATTTAPATATPPATTYVAPTAGQQTETASVIPGSGTGTTGYSGSLYGLPNLSVAISSVGYLDNSGNFIPASVVANDQPLAVQFTVTNNGTNSTGSWSLSALLPTKANSNYLYDSNAQNSLNPGDHVTFTLHLDAGQAEISNDDSITVTVDSNHQVTESNENDNVATRSVDVTE